MERFRKYKTAVFWPMAAALAVAFAVRIALVLATEGYSYDVNCFFAWAQRMAEVGPENFYAPDYFADYPPAYMLVLGVVGWLMKALGLGFQSKGAALLLTLLPVMADCALAWLVYKIGCIRRYNRRVAFRVALFTAFCPPLLFDTAIWKQIDGLFALLLVACFALLWRHRYLPAAFCYGLALAVKPQALILGPVLAVCFLQPLAVPQPGEADDMKTLLRAAGRGAAGAVLALLPVLAAVLPFGQSLPWLLEKYTSTAQSYEYATVNAFNLWAALGGNWKPQGGLLGPITWQQWGVVGLVLLTLALLVLAYLGARRGHFCPLTLAAFYAVGVFTLAHRMHERYLIPGVLLALAAAAKWGDRKLLGSAAGLSLTSLINLAMVYTSVGTEDEFFTSAQASLLVRLVGAAEVICFVALAAAAGRLLLTGKVCPVQLRARSAAYARPAPQPRWGRGEKVFLCALTAMVTALGLTYLGDLTAPQNPLDATGTVLTARVELSGPAQEVWVYAGISGGGTLAVEDAQGTQLLLMELGHGTTFKWSAHALDADGALTVTVSNGTVMEMAFRDAQGALVPVQAGDSALFDEQELVPEAISQLNSTYFDEIYHGRTGYEMLHELPVYETTHPPLGKDFIMLGIAIFGMTGFGWRVAGALFGAGMVPVMYALARRLTRKPSLAALAALLFSLDFMRFSQSRMATIDVYVTFFILLAAYFMVWYCQSVLEKGVERSVLPMALCGLAFGLGCASKWTGIYAGAGLAVLYFGVLYARWRQKQQGFGREAAVTLCGGVVFFVAVPLAVYLLSYLPYWWRDPGFSLADWWACQTYMFSYHSGLNATHSFESRWYTWPLMLRPVWYYMGSGLPEGVYASIAGFGSPVVWWGGFAAMLALGWRQLCGRGSRRGAALCILFLAQLLPWVLVARCTFLYHYFPSVGFTLLALVLWVGRLQKRDAVLARRVGIGLLAVAAVLFLWFYPVLAGVPVPRAWAASLKWLPSWGFYILG